MLCYGPLVSELGAQSAWCPQPRHWEASAPGSAAYDDHISGNTRPIFAKCFVHVTRMLPMAVARSSSGGVVICYVLPVLLMTSHLDIS